MDYKRIFLYLLLVLIGLQLWSAWEIDYPTKRSVVTATTNTVNSRITPTVKTTTSVKEIPEKNKTVATTHQLITVQTDVLKLRIDTLGGDIVKTELLKYPATLNDKQPLQLLSDNADNFYIAQSGLQVGDAASDYQFVTDKTYYQLTDGQNEITVNLNWKDNNGLVVTKSYTFKRNEYLVYLNYKIDNQSKNSWVGSSYLQLERKDIPSVHKGLFNTPTYLGAAISSEANHYQKISFEDMTKNNLQQQITGGWAAMIEHYFVSAWIPPTDQVSTYYSKVNTNNSTYVIGILSPPIEVNVGQQKNIVAKLYLGPEISSNLKAAAPNLDLTVDYGIFWFISAAIMWLMQQIYNVVGNWGWSIVLVTVLIKILFYKLSATSYRSMANMRKLQPRIESLKERYGEDKQKFSQALLEMYRKEKVNPLGGCLPILVQIPVFLGLYWVLIESVELRQAPFMFWIHDLSAKDPYYILPILMGLTMLIQQKLSPAPPDPVQAKVMMMLPIVFTVLFMAFPSGLVLYWLVNNTISVLQQWYITYKFDHESNGKKSNALVKAS